MIHSVLIFRNSFIDQDDQLVIKRITAGGFMDHAAVIFFDHTDRPVQQVAKVIGQISVDAGDQRVARKIAVTAEVDLAQQEITDSIGAKFVDQRQRINDIALGFGHFVAFNYQPAMSVNLFRQFFTHSHQHDRPDDSMETHNFLADQMHVSRPVFIEFFRITAVTDTGKVVEQRVKPDIDNVFVVKRHRDAPVEGGAGDAQIFQPLFDEVDHLVAACHRLNEVGMSFDIFQQTVLIFGKLKEIAFFFHTLYRTAAVGAFAVDQLTLQPVGFAGYTVPAFIILFINIALFKDFLQNTLHNLMMAFFAGTNKIVIGDIEALP